MAENTEELGSRFRMRSSLDFSAVYSTRLSLRTKDLIVCVRRNGLGHPRIGLSVSVKVGNAVVRNRVKRILRDVFRRNRESIPGDFDLVLIPKNSDAMLNYVTAEDAFLDLMLRLTARAKGPE